MKATSSAIGSWAALFGALLAWAVVAFLAYELFHLQAERISYLSNAATVSVQQSESARVRALVKETEANRALLQSISGTDVLSAVNAIESITTGGVYVKVVDAQAEKLTTKTGTSSVNYIVLTARAEGPFSAVLNVLQMLESVPVTTTIQAVSLNRAPVDPGAKNKAATWTLNIRLRFLTNAQLPS